MGQLTFEQMESRARTAIDLHRQTPNHRLHLCDDLCHYLTWALFELDNAPAWPNNNANRTSARGSE